MLVLYFATVLNGAAEHYWPLRVLVLVNKFLSVFTASFKVGGGVKKKSQQTLKST